MRRIGCVALAIVYGAAGVIHLVRPAPFAAITPEWVPYPHTVVALTGFAELLGAAGLLQPVSLPLRRAAGWGLALYALCVWPANYHHMQLDLARADHGLGLAYHVPRMLAQPLIIWWALWASGAVGRRSASSRT
ncbi:DoxX family protein [Novosphingobium chloroacetimidivorans]|uniref:DoxX family protein n=1 Tax=Novosphingobium chloroacetimidivorans TaxID=1428314 RepID=UPI0016088DD4|nr:DoxX family protein [Novosphingobium chloroacetimidivorans]